MQYKIAAIITDKHKVKCYPNKVLPKVEENGWLLDFSKEYFTTLNDAYRNKMESWDRYSEAGEFYYIVIEAK